MQLYLDSANLRELREAASWGILSGVTTNPSLMAKEKGADFQRTIQEIATLIDGPISAETVSLDDYQRLRALTEQGQRFAVISGGFIGSEIAAALALNGKDVVMLFPGTGIGERFFGPNLSAFVTTYYRQHGVEVLAGETAQSLVRLFAQRFAVQERIGRQIVDGLETMLQFHGVAVYLEAHHLCTEMRGVREVSPLTRTTFWRGEYDHNPALRSEFLSICGVSR